MGKVGESKLNPAVLIGIIGGVVVVLAVGGYLLLSGGEEPPPVVVAPPQSPKPPPVQEETSSEDDEEYARRDVAQTSGEPQSEDQELRGDRGERGRRQPQTIGGGEKLQKMKEPPSLPPE